MICGSTRRLRPALAVGLVLLATGPTRAQVGVYSPFYGNSLYTSGAVGYGGIGYGVGYGGFGGIGYGGYGGIGYGGYGGLGGVVGMYPWDQEMIKQQQYQLNASQANLQDAEAARAYWSANLLRQQAIGQYQVNQSAAYADGGPAAGYAPRYNIATAATRPYPFRLGARTRGRTNPALLTREKVLDPDGRILWPAATPRGPEIGSMRQAVDTAFRDLVVASQQHRRTTIRDAVAARDKLYAFGNLAVEKLQAEGRSADLPEFQVFLASLDHALMGMANAAPRALSAQTTPDNTPKSAGSVLKDTITKDARSTDDRPTAPGDTNPEKTPQSAGSVLKDTIEKDRPASERTRPARPADQPPPPPAPDRATTETGGAAQP